MAQSAGVGGIWTVLPLMSLVERFATFCFSRDLPFFLDVDTVDGCLRHRAPSPRSDRLRVHMQAQELDRLLAARNDGLGFWLEPLIEREPAALRVRLGQERVEIVRSCLDSSMDLLVGVPTWCGLMRATDDEERAHDCPADAVRLAHAFATLEAGLAVYGIERPFLVRRCPEFELDTPLLEAAITREQALLAYVFNEPGRGDETPVLAPRRTLELFRAGELQFNITESQVTQLATDCLPYAMQPWLGKDDTFAFSYLITPRGTDTPFHYDRVNEGAYLYLVEGEKYWWFIEREHAAAEQLFRRPMTAILSSDDYRLWGRVWVAHQRAGDLMVFPSGWWHRVLTYAPAIGVGGYLQQPAGW